MKRRLIAFLLGTLMVLSLALPAQAAGIPFTDVPSNAWYYNDVVRAYETGLVNGLTDTTFGPDSNMTYAQAVKLAACMHQKDATGSITLENGSPWYASYVDYAKNNGIITKEAYLMWRYSVSEDKARKMMPQDSGYKPFFE